MRGFMKFVREQGVVGMAVGLAIGISATSAVESVVDNFISPIVGYILGGADLARMSWDTGLERGGNQLIIGWGAIVNGIIFLLATAFVIYFVVHRLKLDKLDKAKK